MTKCTRLKSIVVPFTLFIITGFLQKLSYVELTSMAGNNNTIYPYIVIPQAICFFVYLVIHTVVWKCGNKETQSVPKKEEIKQAILYGTLVGITNLFIIYCLDPNKLIILLQILLNLVGPVLPFVDTYTKSSTKYISKLYLVVSTICFILTIFLTTIDYWSNMFTHNLSLYDLLYGTIYLICVVLLSFSTIVHQQYFMIKRFFLHDKTTFLFWSGLAQLVTVLCLVWVDFVMGNTGNIDNTGNSFDVFYNLFIGKFFETGLFSCMLVISTLVFNFVWVYTNIASSTMTMMMYSVLYPMSYLFSTSLLHDVDIYSILYYGMPALLLFGISLIIFRIWEEMVNKEFIPLDQRQYLEQLIFYE